MLKEGVLYSENDLKLSGTGLSGRKDLCYWNETKRAQDYYEPIPGNWTFLPKVLPIYAHYDCFADKQVSGPCSSSKEKRQRVNAEESLMSARAPVLG